MIQPGLARISQLLAKTALPWRAVHVAGTNGKGTVCSYVAAMLDLYNSSSLRQAIQGKSLSWAKYTSPHLVDRWDGIQINGQVIEERRFKQIEQQVLDRDRDGRIGASEFEIMTATAFETFSAAKVDVGIVEVGMGGTDDATNLLGTAVGVDRSAEEHLDLHRAQPLVTAITAIGLDHQAFLGNTTAEIASHKAGIIKRCVPVVFDESNSSEVQAVIEKRAAEVDAPVIRWSNVPGLSASQADDRVSFDPAMSPAIKNNTSVAVRSAYLVLDRLVGLKQLAQNTESTVYQHYTELLTQWLAVSKNVRVPGRLEQLSVSIGGKPVQLLIDGAHNPQSAALLADSLARLQTRRPLTWLYAASQGRDVEQSLQLLLHPGDSLHAVEFGPVDNMPWVRPVPSDDILAAASKIMAKQSGRLASYGTDMATALEAAAQDVRSEGLLVVTGSLYLVGDVHRILRSADLKP